MSEDPTSTVPSGIPELDAQSVRDVSERAQMLIITGMSGAGRSQTAQVLEDLNWYVVDNLPPRMLGPLARMMTPGGEGVHRLAVVVDVRSRSFFSEFMSTLDALREAQVDLQVLFLDCSDAVLVRRYEQVRRPHPLQGEGRIMDGIASERELLGPIRDRANIYVDTTHMNVHDLARRIRELVSGETVNGLNVTVMSFGFKYGLPMDADHVVDVRFFPNPYWVTELRHLTGRDEAVAKYVLSQPGASEFAQHYVDTLAPVLNGYLHELKPFVTIAVGCTGGQHRSVAMAERLSNLLRSKGFQVRTVHRDIGKE
ncbi:RNase adapter RapZ [uncultured Mobiluncus sp.]|uniref:RNase adapter RapZ n=1 Tax=uncultured Mobiluncus sp. TaxID=293425 RepID=UPI0025D774B3|nr:RNase adapter RapZ [uncultured Mobiluncus sp.]